MAQLTIDVTGALLSTGQVQKGRTAGTLWATLAEPMSPGAVSLPFTIADAQGRTAACAIGFTATSAPTGQCCASNQACATMTAYNCGQAGGV